MPSNTSPAEYTIHYDAFASPGAISIKGPLHQTRFVTLPPQGHCKAKLQRHFINYNLELACEWHGLISYFPVPVAYDNPTDIVAPIEAAWTAHLVAARMTEPQPPTHDPNDWYTTYGR